MRVSLSGTGAQDVAVDDEIVSTGDTQRLREALVDN